MTTVSEEQRTAQYTTATDIFVGGEWRKSSATETIAVINPATEETIGEVARGTAEDVDLAAKAAAAAFDGWSQTPNGERAAAIHRLADLLEVRGDELTKLIVSEVGQPITFAVGSQTDVAVSDLRHFADAINDVAWVELVEDFMVRREPAGVVGAIAAWNGPLRSVALKAGAALAAGCTVVVKPSEIAPLSAYVFANLVNEAGIPAGVFNLVSGEGPVVGEAIASHPLIDVVSLTGSVRAGSRVMELGSRSIKRMALELGGKSANVILEDADLEQAINVGLDDAFRNAGQVCGGLSRTLVPRSRLAEAEQIAVAKAESFLMGDPLDPSTTLGPVITERQRERIRDYIRSAQTDGVRMLVGGAEQPEGFDCGYYIKATVFSGDNHDRLAQEEIFGPVNIIIPFDSEADAIGIANDSSYGLAGAVWSGDPEHARAVAARLRTGRIRINGTPINMKAPHGGFKLSGIGREMGRYGIEEFLEYKSVIG
ncbi:aldehyde dehydrogenase family protein [Conexibacter sp. S30A1]|uniref:aldehyde dehydrogenase family protein n=1 Tax=Conexibacter sp. S30A1 TaxID=2937800 RepID=UPI00201009F0|nr:aldehyde dehydrogenase family protein [Conexibacter sp. S30A1]